MPIHNELPLRPVQLVKRGPQARDDSAAGGENAVIEIDVLANDLGGTAKRLWSLDQQSPDLLSAPGQIVTLPSGATVRFVGDRVIYDPGTAFDYLGEGERATDTFRYSIRMADGVVSVASVTVALTGSNDAPIVSGPVEGSAVEDGPAVALSALANASDVDGPSLSAAVVPATLPAGVTFDPLGGTFTLDPSHSAYQSLNVGDTIGVSVAYSVTDGSASTAASVNWLVEGRNDAPVVTGPVQGAAVEDGPAVTLSALANASDVDDSELSVVSLAGVLPAGVSYNATDSTFTLDPSHAAFQSLRHGDSVNVTVEFQVSDGAALTPGSVSWTVAGRNEPWEPLGDQFQINQSNLASQQYSAVADLPDGRFIVLWQSFGQGPGLDQIFARTFYSDGESAGGQGWYSNGLPGDNHSEGIRTSPAVATTDDALLALWGSDQFPDQDFDIWGNLLNGDSVSLGAGLFVGGASSQNHPAISELRGDAEFGLFAMTWTSTFQDGSDAGVYARIVSSEAGFTSPWGDFQVNGFTAGDQYYPAIAGLAGGGFVVSWTSEGQDGSGNGVYARQYAADGTPGSEFRVNFGTLGNQEFSTVAALSDGGYVIAWAGIGGSGQDVFAQRFAADGSRVGSEFRVNTFSLGNQNNADAIGLPDGGWVIAWVSQGQDGDGTGIYSQRYGADGSLVGSEFQVNTVTANDQTNPDLAVTTDQTLVVTWDSYETDGHLWGVYGRVFALDVPPSYIPPGEVLVI